MVFPKQFIRRAVFFCTALLLLRPPAGAIPSSETDTAGTDTYTCPEHTVVGYYAGWASYQGYQPADIPAHLLTHINYAFAMIDPDTGTLVLDNPQQDQKNFSALRALREEGYIGDICLNPFKINGEWEDYRGRSSIIGASIATLQKIPNVVAIAGGPQKVNAILGALRLGCIDVLVTDSDTARQLALAAGISY